jgi:hypothetical protein
MPTTSGPLKMTWRFPDVTVKVVPLALNVAALRGDRSRSRMSQSFRDRESRRVLIYFPD